MCDVWAPAAGPGDPRGGGGGQLRAQRAGRVPGTVLYCTVLYCTVPAVLQGEQLQVTRSPAVTPPASFYSAPVRDQQWCVGASFECQ